MTQQRDAKKDLEFLDKSCVTAVFSISEYWIKESEKMKARTNQLASESSKQFVAMTNALMRAEAAEQELEAQRIRADKAEEEAKHQESRAKRYCNDYHEACRFQLEYGRQAELAEQERDKLKELVNTIDEALDEEFKLGGWDDFMNLIHKEITAYREGSNTDEHTSNSIQSQE
ncbi:regulator of protease activity HflC (stomatin/prohibitin superfamily) [Paenibacillus sp. SORGH_AS306]|uniref:hypothetical protein n=1 Tax=unclassified Paenibacillus TaxID=185978 RepID=UPI002781E83D|nr:MULTISPECIES: hypothetical protein [unclassified Paenibacillus]MDQ1233329.1 regulator of protease activity HflC (stomatin/prohibitin superfamily) [Paenibacillus sp. SORGH_AS_0306]MDR6110370.1 regulator of protease activity HflC (stomatin/prohibitin superfamily) [Paenibacillus sp. SORGH_AS_0338]